MNKTKFFMVGSDPEAFLRDQHGKLVSAVDYIPGTKEQPHPTPHGSIQVDNMLAEFNSRPSSSLSEFIENHRLIIGDLRDHLAPLNLKLDFIGSMMVDKLLLLSHPSLMRAGCEPDFNAWTLRPNEPADYFTTDLRAAGGHLHCSFDQASGTSQEAKENRIKFVKSLDLVLGVPSVIHDPDNARREVYGKAGAHRPKDKSKGDPYDGVEYRTLSNFWLKSEELMAFVWKGVELVYNNLQDLSEQAEFYKDDINRIINTGSRFEAEIFCRTVGINASII